MASLITINHFTQSDWQAISQIYEKGIATGLATFETKIPDWSIWDAIHLDHCRFKALIQDTIVGWAALAPVSSRYVYRGVAEVSVYVDPLHHNSGIGTQLLKQLIEHSETKGIWSLQSSIFSTNSHSFYLHKKLGFRKIGYREKIGQLNGQWYDNILMEKRSKIIL